MLRMLSGAIPSTWALALTSISEVGAKVMTDGEAGKRETCSKWLLCRCSAGTVLYNVSRSPISLSLLRVAERHVDRSVAGRRTVNKWENN